MCLRRQYAGWVNNGRQPEPKLQEDAKKLPDIPKKHIQDPQGDAQPNRQTHQDQQQGQHCQKCPSREITGKNQEQGEQPEDDREIDQRTCHQHHWQAQPGEAHFLQQPGVFQKCILCPAGDLAEQAPGENAGTQINTVSKGLAVTGQTGVHHLRENKCVDHDHRQRIHHRPRRPKQRVSVLHLKLPLHTFLDEASIAPQPTQHAHGLATIMSGKAPGRAPYPAWKTRTNPRPPGPAPNHQAVHHLAQ